jgi:hypothetical protein
MPEPQEFTAELHDAGRGGSAFDVPHAVAAALSEEKRPPVTVTIGGHTYRTRIAVYGGQPMVGMSKANRAKAGIDIGDRFDVTLALDEEPRVVEVPDDLAAALADDAEAAAAFERLAYTHRREHVIWITEARKPETRARRVAATLDRLRGGS